MFKVGHIYTHAHLLDVCMFVIQIRQRYIEDSGMELDVRWFKRNGLDLNAKDSIFICDKDLKDWYEYDRQN